MEDNQFPPIITPEERKRTWRITRYFNLTRSLEMLYLKYAHLVKTKLIPLQVPIWVKLEDSQKFKKFKREITPLLKNYWLEEEFVSIDLPIRDLIMTQARSDKITQYVKCRVTAKLMATVPGCMEDTLLYEIPGYDEALDEVINDTIDRIEKF